MMDFNPTKGHEQRGYRPAIVLSHSVFNQYTNMIIVCPISSNTKDFPTHYILQDSKKVSGAVLLEHVRSIDYDSRKIKFREKVSDIDLISILTLFDTCIND